MKAVRHHIREPWILLYIERWLLAPFEAQDGTRLPRARGTPQGGVVSPLLMNLFMHYAFDRWMQKMQPDCPFARYADDAVVHCRTRQQADTVMGRIAERLAKCGLTMHPDKSRVVYCRDSNRTASHPYVTFTFLGYQFRPRKALTRGGRLFTAFLPGVSPTALTHMRAVVRGWHLPRRTPASLAEFAEQCNPTIRGWWNYYGAFYRTAMFDLARYIDRTLERWAGRKFKRLLRRQRRSQQWLRRMKEAAPDLFYHWRMVGTAG
jgi:RNA-directed DNA polymerase